MRANNTAGLWMKNTNDKVNVSGLTHMTRQLGTPSTAPALSNIQAGVLTSSGSFDVGFSDAFLATGSHKVVLSGAAVQKLTFNAGTNPDTSRKNGTPASHAYFQNLDITNSAGIDIAALVTVNGTLTIGNTITPVLKSAVEAGVLAQTYTLSAANASINGATVDSLLLEFTGASVALSNITIQNQDSTLNQITVNTTAAMGTITWNNFTFNTTPTSGSFMDVPATSTGAGTITLTASTPRSGIWKVSQVGTPTINWGTNVAPSFNAAPSVSGTANAGQTLSLSNTATTDADGDAVVLSYQWQKGGVDIAGATNATYTPVLADIRNTIGWGITSNDSNGGVTTTTADVI